MTNGFKLIGITTRTTNKNNQALQDLGKLWSQFYAENIIDKIPNKIGNEVLAIYTDYKSDFTEDYTTFIGVRVSSIEEVPDGLIGREFEANNFQKFTAKGEMPAAVGSAWMEIWKNDTTLNRKYNYDFEVYSDKSQQGEDSEVDIFISIK